MSENKIEVKLTFEDFVKQYKNSVEFKQLDAKSYKDLITLKAIQEQTKELNFSNSWKKEIEDKCIVLKESAEKELKEASNNIDKFLFNLVKDIYNYHKAVCTIPSDEIIKEQVKKIREIVTIIGTMDSQTIFDLTKTLYINK
jgi:hypothetical protein